MDAVKIPSRPLLPHRLPVGECGGRDRLALGATDRDEVLVDDPLLPEVLVLKIGY